MYYDKLYQIIRKHWDLTPDSFKKLENIFENQFIDPVYKKIVGDSLKKEFKIEPEIFSQFDRAWLMFKSDVYAGNFVKDKNITYTDFINWKKDNIKLYKLFKNWFFNLDVKVGPIIPNFSEKEIKEHLWNTIIEPFLSDVIKNRLKVFDLKLVLTLDFYDWFTSSTGNGWHTCLALDGSSFGGTLPGIFPDRNRAMLYITNGDKKNFLGIETEKFVVRTWLLLDKDDNMNIVKWYPLEINSNFVNQYFPIKDIDTKYISKYPIDFLYLNNSRIPLFIFLDKSHLSGNKIIGGNKWKPKGIKYCENLEENDSFIITSNQFKCSECGRELYEDYEEYDGEYYCIDCFNELFYTCENCLRVIPAEDSYYYNGETLCEDCYNEIVAEEV